MKMVIGIVFKAPNAGTPCFEQYRTNAQLKSGHQSTKAKWCTLSNECVDYGCRVVFENFSVVVASIQVQMRRERNRLKYFIKNFLAINKGSSFGIWKSNTQDDN